MLMTRPMQSRQTMSLLGCTKSGFMFCVGLCLILLAINNFNQPEDRLTIEEIKECGFYPGELCKALFEEKPSALVVGKICQEALPPPREDGAINLQFNCSTLINNLHFITKPLSSEEADYPLAYILTIHKQLHMFIKLFSAIYTPQNVYCIHIDKKSPKTYSQAVWRLASCFQNVFIASQQETVVYAGFSRLRADINCMEDLVRSDVLWRHVINLCGQDFPMKTNREIVQYLKSKWKGRNLTPGVIQPPHMRYRTQITYKEFVHMGMSYAYPTQRGKAAPPHNITLYFGTAYYALTREFVEFLLTDQRAKDLLEWSKESYSPDEHYWVTLNRMKDFPGSTPDAGWEGNIRAVKWRDQEGTLHSGCSGHYVRDICIYGLGDLRWLIDSPHLFANKFDPNLYGLVTDCLERHHRHRVLEGAEVPVEKSWYLQDEYSAEIIP
ncbi:beta-1,3-galactosyl-O-glycosyl-glycoprotein beta-1,6-N-acetylglucosaminyltransferase 7-like isoform X2 [Bufo gargarizans]|nr:beta-1,3-galactosyl-O-glycosyl-glycoprotein beta-1,6-N-acetylglucosaminyltransferase 7-like isoform X2 [Bufo gargarizans]XP_044155735.1 beta-1,3-galactosyl-O-glycosyl-glycoprotein beta-1,6-N-acetylglucosaminyltransferase 7-like isoform X2 [Bufo gargarizans]XP_044155736.1 beta-1,3-galactosyl-O-glycosyl-glycoprotein beta-1,6-N-acetylglucosaminyltransferase 7-like isoform X2 [Bufo gargarizans]